MYERSDHFHTGASWCYSEWITDKELKKAKKYGKGYCPDCSGKGDYTLKYYDSWFWGLYRNNYRRKTFRVEDPEQYTFLGATFCGKCKHILGHPIGFRQALEKYRRKK